MKKFLLIASAAAMAASMPAAAKPGNGHGNGNGGGHSEGRGGENHGGGGKAQKQNFKGAERQLRAQNQAVERQIKAQQRQAQRIQRARFERDDDRFDNDRFDRDDQRRARSFNQNEFGQNGAFCPPGLAKKNNGCLPPGQAKRVLALGQQLNPAWYPNYNVPADYRNFYPDTQDYYYRYDQNGNIYRVDRQSNLVSGLIPLLGGGFGVGQALPAGYNAYNVPPQYRDTYYDTNDAYYRYGDNAIYKVNPQSNMIESVVALLTGDNLGVGQMLPAGYDTYNLPLQYRDQYADTNQYNYRYADGNIYQLDPQTQIIQSIISALI